MRSPQIVVACSLLLLTSCAPSAEEALSKGSTLYDMGSFEEAMPLLERAYAAGIDDPELVVRVAYCRAMIGGDPTSAISILMESLLSHPDYARTYYELGYISEQFGDPTDNRNLRKAVEFTLKAAELDTTNWKIFDNLGMFYGKLGVLDSSALWLRKAQQLNPDYAELNARLQELEAYLEQMADTTAQTDTLELND